MKKLVTLSAIALAGATLGVGTTFGWWADDSEDSPKHKIKTLDVVPDLQPQSVEVFLKEQPSRVTEEAKPKVVIVQTKSPDGKSETVSGHIHFVQTGGNSAALEKLADELEQEAKEFEGHGQKEAAEIQRKLAQRLRATIKAGQANLKVRHLPPDVKPRHTKSEGEASAEDVKRKLGVLKRELKDRDPEPKKNPEAYAQELKARIHEIETNPKAHQDAEAQLDKLRAALEQQARIMASEKDSNHQAKARHLDQVVGSLRETAEKLEQAGRKDEAHAIREKAEHILRSLKEEHHPKFEKHDIIVEDGQKIIRLRRESKDGTGEEELAIIQAEPKGPRKVIGKELHEKGDLPAHIKVEGIRHVEAAPLFEVQRTLKELHHEIQELREEVRGLRGLLGAETARSSKQKARDHEDNQRDDEDKVEKTNTKEYKARFRDTVKGEGEGEGEKREGEKKKPAPEKRDDDDDDDAKSDKREEKDDDDKKSDDRKDKDDDGSAGTDQVFRF